MIGTVYKMAFVALKENVFYRVYRFYYDGFQSMTIGKKLWIIILVKLFIIFIILKIFFFPDFLGSRFDTEKSRSDYVTDELTKRQIND